MPWKDRAKVRAYQRRWYARKSTDKSWHDKRNAEKRARNHAVRATALRLIERSRQNEHNYRMREWEHKHRSAKERQIRAASGIHVISVNRLKNPKFTVIDKYGMKRTELLHEPLPTW